MLLGKTPDRVGEDTKACGRGSCSVAEYTEVMVKREFLIEENAQPSHDRRGDDGAIWEYEGAKKVGVLSSGEVDKLRLRGVDGHANGCQLGDNVLDGDPEGIGGIRGVGAYGYVRKNGIGLCAIAAILVPAQIRQAPVAAYMRG